MDTFSIPFLPANPVSRPAISDPEISASVRPFVGIVVNHTHWDREWYMPFQRYRVLLVDAVDKLLETLATKPDFKGFMLDGQTAIIEDYLEVRPEQRPVLTEFVRSGRIVVGPWYVLPDEFLPSGESLIRNLLLGRKQMREVEALPAKVGYLPDTFGHPAQLPQILAGFDLESTVIFRGVQSNTSEFIWQAPDGTPLLTIYLPGGYYNAMEMARAPHFWLNDKMAATLEQVTRFATTDSVLIMNGCDHFEPQPITQQILDEANQRQKQVFLQQGTLSEYVERVRHNATALEVKAGEWRYNRPARITPGVLSARMYLKQADFRAAIQLERGAEPLQTLAWLLGGNHDSGLLATAWKYLLQNHPHDSICGCSVDEVHRDCESRFEWSQQISGDLVERATTAFCHQLSLPAFTQNQNAQEKAPGFALFNTLATPRREIIRQRLHFLEPGATFELLDYNNQTIAYQEIARRPLKIQYDPQRHHFHCEGRTHPAIVVSPLHFDSTRWQRWQGEEVELLFQADLPAGGFSVINSKQVGVSDKAPLTAAIPAISWGSHCLENELVRIEAAQDGSLTLLDKNSGRTYGPLNVFRSEADRGDEYSFCPVEADKPVSSLNGQARIQLIESGPLRATLEIRLILTVPAQLTADRTCRVADMLDLAICSRVSLTPGRRRVEVQTELTNTVRDHRLRVLCATGVQTEVADAQGQFQVMRRPVALPLEERLRVPEFDEEQEVSYHPQRAFVDVSDAGGGLAILNRGLPEYEAEPAQNSTQGVWLGLTLLRCVGWLSRDDLTTRYKHAGPPLETQEAQCLGSHLFEYAFVPHSGDWLTGGIAPEAEAYVTPIYSATLTEQQSSGPHSFYHLGPDELLFSACKRSEDGQYLLLRAYNTAPYPVEAMLQLGFEATLQRANLAERELWPISLTSQTKTTACYRFPVRPHEIFTLAIKPTCKKEP